MVVRGRSALALLMAITVTACAAVAGIESAEPDVTLPDRGEGADSGSESGADGGSAHAPDASPIKDAAPDAAPPPGMWVQANGQDCGPFCTARGKTNVASVEGAKCTSGENIPASALAAGITYTSCFPSCAAHVGPNAASKGQYCYASGQNTDNDPSDVTRGCFCR